MKLQDLQEARHHITPEQKLKKIAQQAGLTKVKVRFKEAARGKEKYAIYFDPEGTRAEVWAALVALRELRSVSFVARDNPNRISITLR